MQRSKPWISGFLVAVVLAACVFSLGARRADEPAAHAWEYKWFNLPPESTAGALANPGFQEPVPRNFTKESMSLTFKGLGDEGWELVCIDKGTAYFKRPKK